MTAVPKPSTGDICPLLTTVMNDRLWLVPTSAYCRQADGRIRLPARTTVVQTCTTRSYLRCAGYRASLASVTCEPY